MCAASAGTSTQLTPVRAAHSFLPRHPASLRQPRPASAHTGYTGTSLWIDPDTDTFVVLLSNAVHSPGNTPISALRGQVATAAALALHLCSGSSAAEDGSAAVSGMDAPRRNTRQKSQPAHWQHTAFVLSPGGAEHYTQAAPASAPLAAVPTLTGIDVLEATNFEALRAAAERHDGHLRLGLLTNQTGLDSAGRRTIDVLVQGLAQHMPNARLTTLFSPEHGPVRQAR